MQMHKIRVTARLVLAPLSSFERMHEIHMKPRSREASTQTRPDEQALAQTSLRGKENRTHDSGKPPHPVPDADGMVLLGRSTYIPYRAYRKINWASYSRATRKLLIAVFYNDLSIAEIDTRPVESLDPVKIKDIVETVSQKCDVPEKVVRTCVTEKRATEAKMHQIRRLVKKAQKSKRNMSPRASSD